jgi:hypothetical protein
MDVDSCIVKALSFAERMSTRLGVDPLDIRVAMPASPASDRTPLLLIDRHPDPLPSALWCSLQDMEDAEETLLTPIRHLDNDQMTVAAQLDLKTSSSSLLTGSSGRMSSSKIRRQSLQQQSPLSVMGDVSVVSSFVPCSSVDTPQTSQQDGVQYYREVASNQLQSSDYLTDPLRLEHWPPGLRSRLFAVSVPEPELFCHSPSCVVYWVRDCWRLHDNHALCLALFLCSELQLSLRVVCVLQGEEEGDLSGVVPSLARQSFLLLSSILAFRDNLLASCGVDCEIVEHGVEGILHFLLRCSSVFALISDDGCLPGDTVRLAPLVRSLPALPLLLVDSHSLTAVRSHQQIWVDEAACRHQCAREAAAAESAPPPPKDLRLSSVVSPEVVSDISARWDDLRGRLSRHMLSEYEDEAMMPGNWSESAAVRLLQAASLSEVSPTSALDDLAELIRAGVLSSHRALRILPEGQLRTSLIASLAADEYCLWICIVRETDLVRGAREPESTNWLALLPDSYESAVPVTDRMFPAVISAAATDDELFNAIQGEGISFIFERGINTHRSISRLASMHRSFSRPSLTAVLAEVSNDTRRLSARWSSPSYR